MKLIHLLAALPFVGVLAGVAFANRVEPSVLNFPFLPQALADTNIGVVALFVNFVVLETGSLATGGLTVRREQSA